MLVELPDSEQTARLLSKSPPDVELFVPTTFDDVHPGSTPLEQRPVVIGSGPAGLLAGYLLAVKGYRPLMIERGQPVRSVSRQFDCLIPADHTIPKTTTSSAREEPAHSVTASSPAG